MPVLNFKKYHCGGNDFMLFDHPIDSRFTPKQFLKLSHRRFGVGCDGFLFLSPSLPIQEKSAQEDFILSYFNADGSKASLCGNGLMCSIYAFKKENKPTIVKCDLGRYSGFLDTTEMDIPRVSIEFLPPTHFNKSLSVELLKQFPKSFFVNTGVPHLSIHVQTKEILQNLDVKSLGKQFCFDQQFAPDLTNVNFYTCNHDNESVKMDIRTYERGVFDETYACGTGMMASALSCNFFHPKQNSHNSHWDIQSAGGSYKVQLTPENKHILIGEPKCVFQGSMDI